MMTRDDSGKFIKGNPGGPGRKPMEREQRYYDIVRTRCSYDDWTAIVDRAVRDAKTGDSVARKWLADYLIGPPVERKEITGKDGEAFIINITERND